MQCGNYLYLVYRLLFDPSTPLPGISFILSIVIFENRTSGPRSEIFQGVFIQGKVYWRIFINGNVFFQTFYSGNFLRSLSLMGIFFVAFLFTKIIFEAFFFFAVKVFQKMFVHVNVFEGVFFLARGLFFSKVRIKRPSLSRCYNSCDSTLVPQADL